MNKFSKLLLIVMLMCSVSMLCSVYATNYYIGFTDVTSSNHYTATNVNLKSVLDIADADDTVYIAKNCKFYLDVELTVNTHIIGGCVPTGDGSQKTAIGAAKSITDSMTVLDGNSFRHPRRVEKHRVATVNTGGIIENCLIRNGHARGITDDNNDLNGHGGGVLLNGGKLYNCIIRGNVAMNVQYKNSNNGTQSSGGGVYITNNGGEVVNCVIAFNMDDKGVGIDGKSGESINNTVAYNTETPTWVNIPAGSFQHFNSDAVTFTGPWIYLSSFYIANTECTNGQFACFMSAIDFTLNATPYLTVDDKAALIAAKAPVPADYTGYAGGITVKDYALLDYNTSYLAGTGVAPSTSIFNLLSAGSYNSGLVTNAAPSANLLWYPIKGAPSAAGEGSRRDNSAINCVSWWGGLCFSLWLGGCLPTEAQWEYAGRQGVSDIDNSKKYAGCNTEAELPNYAWYSSNSGSKVHDVARKNSTGKGLYDMSGNLWEWVLDIYGTYPGSGASNVSATTANGKWLVSGDAATNVGAASGTALRNAVACVQGSNRVLRGGNWNNAATICSLGYRNYYYPNNCDNSVGFRAVCVP
jgi:formylglycine-generating enzyme required for sulfatase activity